MGNYLPGFWLAILVNGMSDGMDMIQVTYRSTFEYPYHKLVRTITLENLKKARHDVNITVVHDVDDV